MRKFSKPLFLAMFICLFAGIAYWDELRTKRDKSSSLDAKKIFTFKANDIVKIAYSKVQENGSRVEVKLEKILKDWKIISPIIFSGDSEGIARLLKTLEDLNYEKLFEADGSRLGDFGLENPKITLDLVDKSGHQYTLYFGGKSPIGYSAYMKIGQGSSVYLVNNYAVTASDKELFDFRDKGLGLPQQADIKAITFQRGVDKPVSIELVEKEWWIESPQKLKADAGAIDAFIEFLNSQKIERFLDQPSSILRQALSVGQKGTVFLAKIAIIDRNNKSFHLSFLENNGQIYGILPEYSGFVLLDKRLRDGLDQVRSNFQDLSLFSFNSTEATEVNKDGRVYVRQNDSWVDKSTKKESDSIKLMLLDLEFAKAEAIISKLEALPLMYGAPMHVVKISFNDTSFIDFSMWKTEDRDGSVLIKVGSDRFYRVSRKLLDNFNPNPSGAEVNGTDSKG